MSENVQLSDSYQKNIRRAVEILKGAGCTDVFLFGSLTTGETRDGSDIDLAIRGCPKVSFSSLGRLLLELDYPVDLVSLDRQNDFAHYLEKKGGLLRIG